MIDEETLAQINGKYACPPDAGPEWRAAMEAGCDMWLLERTLALSPEERSNKHQQVLDFILKIYGTDSQKSAAQSGASA